MTNNKEQQPDVISVSNLTKVFDKKYSNKEFFTLKAYLLKRKEAISDENNNKIFIALKDVSFSVKKGETFGIIGRNGSGKSTLLKIIGGIMKPTQGTVVTNGRMATLIELGAGFHPEFTGRENLFINAHILGIPMNKVKRIYDEIVEFSGIGDFIDNPVKTYSSGMYMRLAFSVAIHVNPDILLIDEILAVGDEMFQHKCKSVINDFRRRGKTIVIVGHDMESIRRLCSRVLYLGDGKTCCVGQPDEVIQHYMERVRDIEEDEMQKSDTASKPAKTIEKEEEEEDEGDKKRWGRREVEIVETKIFSEDGKEKHVLMTDDPVQIEIKYKVNSSVDNVIFGIAIHRDDGVLCFGTNTKADGVKILDIGDEGKVVINIERLSLITGTYFLDVAVHPEDGPDYDYHSHLYSFVMSSNVRDTGVYRPTHSWKIYPKSSK